MGTSESGVLTAEMDFVTDPLIREFQDALLRQSKATARLYGGFLYTYYKNVIRSHGLAIARWVSKVKEESKSEDVKVRTKWARDLESYVTSYVSEETGRPYAFKSRKVMVSAVRKFLVDNIGERLLEPYKFKLQTSEEKLREEQAKDEFVPISVDEYRKLVLGANTVRDRAILLSLPGMGVGEWLQFAHGWFKHADAIRNLKVPIRVGVVRPKNKQHYSVLLWDDSIQFLNLLMIEREKELGRPLRESDHLFISTYGDKITGHRVQHMVRFLADKLGLERREKGKIIYKFRPHEIGRDFFRTLCENLGVSNAVAEYSLGHKIDQNEYNKFHNTPEGKSRIEKELSKLRESLNVMTGRGNITEKDVAKNIEKLEALEKARKAEEDDTKRQVEKIRTELSELREAAKTGSPEAVVQVLTRAEERVKADMAETRRFSNHTHDYIKTRMTNQDFDQAIVEGWEIVLQSPDGYVLLRKRKASLDLDIQAGERTLGA